MWGRSFVRSAATVSASTARLDAIDRRIIEATQTGLPVTSKPYHAIAEQLDLEPQLVITKMKRMQRQGIIRRIAAVPNHYALGYLANAMTVWDVRDDRVTELGMQVGQLPFVSHCYHRPRHFPEWPYNLFAMVQIGRASCRERV